MLLCHKLLFTLKHNLLTNDIKVYGCGICQTDLISSRIWALIMVGLGGYKHQTWTDF